MAMKMSSKFSEMNAEKNSYGKPSKAMMKKAKPEAPGKAAYGKARMKAMQKMASSK